MHLSRILVAIVAVGSGLAIGVAFAAGDSAAGKAVYDKSCRACHGPEGEGNDKIAKMVGVPIPPLGSKEVQGLSDKELQTVLTKGKGKMKGVSLTDGQASDVVAHIRSLGKK